MDLFCIGLCKGLFGTLHLTGIFRHLLVITFFWGVNMGSLYFLKTVKKKSKTFGNKKRMWTFNSWCCRSWSIPLHNIFTVVVVPRMGDFHHWRARGHGQSRDRWSGGWMVFQLRLTGQQRHERFVPIMMASQPTPLQRTPPQQWDLIKGLLTIGFP